MDKFKIEKFRKEFEEDMLKAFQQFNGNDINDDINTQRLENTMNDFLEKHQATGMLDNRLKFKIDPENGYLYYEILFDGKSLPIPEDMLLSDYLLYITDKYGAKTEPEITIKIKDSIIPRNPNHSAGGIADHIAQKIYIPMAYVEKANNRPGNIQYLKILNEQSKDIESVDYTLHKYIGIPFSCVFERILNEEMKIRHNAKAEFINPTHIHITYIEN